MSGQLLGVSVLELRTDQAPLDAGLALARRKVIASTGEMQALVDRRMVAFDQRMASAGRSLDSGLGKPVERVGLASRSLADDLAAARVASADMARGVQRDAAAAAAASEAQAAAADRATRAYERQAAAARAAGGISSTPTGVGADRRNVNFVRGVQGVRGPGGGTIQDPVVVVVEDAARTQMGTYAAPVGSTAAAGPSKRVDIYHHSGSGTGGSGGSGSGGGRFVFGPGGGRGGNGGILSRLLWGGGGGGRIPLTGIGVAGAGFGSLASFAGLGAEHILTTLGAVAGSAGTATVGAGLLGLGTLGQMAVGGGSDLAVTKSALSNAQNAYKAYESLQTAISTYGAKSQQAATAQKQLNATLADMPPKVAKASLALAKQGSALGDLWQKATAGAQVKADHILSQLMGVAAHFVPAVAKAASQNLTIIDNSLKPLFSWLEGPKGMGIFNDLENRFKTNLPHAIHAFDQAVELLLREMDVASQYTGGLTKWLDKLFTRLNSEPTSKLESWTQRMIHDFDLWKALLKELGIDIYDLFKNDAGTGQGIVVTLTHMLDKLHAWETSTRGKAQLQSIFAVHKQEIIAILQMLPALTSGFGSLYLTVAPPLVKAVTGIANGLASVLNWIDKLGPAARTLLGLALVAGKLGVLGTVLNGMGKELRSVASGIGLVSAAEQKNAGAPAGAPAAVPPVAGGVPAETPPVETGMFANLKSKLMSGAMRGLMVGSLGALASDALGSAIPGAVGAGIKAVGTDASIGAGLGAIFGPEGMAGGAIIGGLVGTFTHFFKSPSLGQQAADALTKGFGGANRASLQKTVANAVDQLNKYTTGSKTETVGGGRFGLPHQITVPVALKISQLPPAEQAKALAAAKTAGDAVAKQLEAGWSQYKFQSEPVMFTQLKAEMRKLPPEAQTYAIQSAVSFMRGLERQGHVAKGSTDQFLAQIMSAFPAAVSQIGAYGQDSVAAFSRALDFRDAEQKLRADLRNVSNDFSFVQQSVTDASGGIEDKSGAAIKALRAIAANGSGPMRRQALADIKALRSGAESDFAAMAKNVQATAAGMTDSIRAGSQKAKQTAIDNFAKLQAGIYNAMSGGLLSTAQGMKLITQALNATLKALGVKEIPVPYVQSALPKSSGLSGAASPRGVTSASGGAAQGALVQIGRPGEAGRDSVPLNVGGMPIMVAPGEQVAVINRHQAPIINRALAREGYAGLSGLFGAVRRPNYLATGGYVDPYGALSVGRTDEGKDFGGAGPVGAIGPGVVDSVGLWPGWPGAGGVVYALTAGPRSGRKVYIMEDFSPSAHAGERLGPGTVLGRATGGPSGIESGWANVAGTGPLTPYGGAADGTPMPGGQDFWAFVSGLAHGKIIGASLAGGMGWSPISAPRIDGKGALQRIVQAAMAKVAQGANAYGSAHAGAGGSTAGLSGSLVHMVTQLAGRFGWSGQVQDWLNVISKESGGSLTATNPSSGAYGIAQFINGPGEYAQYGGNATTMSGQLLAMGNYIRGRYGNPAAAWAHEVAYNWYDRGGLVPMFASGGAPLNGKRHPRPDLKARQLKHRKGVAKGRLKQPKGHPLGAGLSFAQPPGAPQDMKVIAQTLARINGLDGQSGDAAKLGEIISWNQGLWGFDALNYQSAPADFVITDPTTGQPIGIDTTSLDRAVGELHQQLSWQQQIVSDLEGALSLSHYLVPLIEKAIEARKRKIAALKAKIRKQIEKIKAKIRANLAKIKALRNAYSQPHPTVLHLRQAINTAQARPTPSGKAGAQARAAKAAQLAVLRNQLLAAESGDKQNKSKLQGQIRGLETQNQQLGGDMSKVGTGGELGRLTKQLSSSGQIGQWNRQIATLNNELSTAQGFPTSIAGVSGFGGDLATNKLALMSTEQQYAALSGTSPASALSAAAAQWSASNAGSSNNSALVSLLQQQNTTLAQTAAVEAVELSQLKLKLPPFGGTFHTGGIVGGGRIGEERMARVLVGEKIIPIGGDSGAHHVQVVVQDGAVDPNKIRVIARSVTDGQTRTMARNAGRNLPGAGGGMQTGGRIG